MVYIYISYVAWKMHVCSGNTTTEIALQHGDAQHGCRFYN
jgi:hypothetical protein